MVCESYVMPRLDILNVLDSGKLNKAILKIPALRGSVVSLMAIHFNSVNIYQGSPVCWGCESWRDHWGWGWGDLEGRTFDCKKFPV